jgi:hypothetical protein
VHTGRETDEGYGGSAHLAAACTTQACSPLAYVVLVAASSPANGILLLGLLVCICLFDCTCSYVQRAVRLKEAASRWFFQQLIIGLDYCHRRGVVNRDIKLENTLLQVRGSKACWSMHAGLQFPCVWSMDVSCCCVRVPRKLVSVWRHLALPVCAEGQSVVCSCTRRVGRLLACWPCFDGLMCLQLLLVFVCTDGPGFAAALAEDLRLWVQQGSLYERTQVQGRRCCQLLHTLLGYAPVILHAHCWAL